MVVLLVGASDLARLMQGPAGPDLSWLLAGPSDPEVVEVSRDEPELALAAE